jgi:hypothetical protein
MDHCHFRVFITFIGWYTYKKLQLSGHRWKVVMDHRAIRKTQCNENYREHRKIIICCFVSVRWQCGRVQDGSVRKWLKKIIKKHSVPVDVILDLWRTNCHWARYFQVLRFSMPILSQPDYCTFIWVCPISQLVAKERSGFNRIQTYNRKIESVQVARLDENLNLNYGRWPDVNKPKENMVKTGIFHTGQTQFRRPHLSRCHVQRKARIEGLFTTKVVVG